MFHLGIPARGKLVSSVLSGVVAVAVLACVQTQSTEIDLSEIPKCAITISDRIASFDVLPGARVNWRYVRSRLVDQEIKLSHKLEKRLLVFSSAHSDLKAGDIITHIYGLELKDYAHYFDLMELNINRTIDLTVLRNGKKRKVLLFNHPCKYFSNSRIERALYNELSGGRPVNLLVLKPKVVLFIPESKKHTETSIQRLLATDPGLATALYGIQGFDNFKILEDRKFDILLKELELKQLGLIDERTAIRMGKVTGANFVAETTFRLFGSDKTLDGMEVTKKIYSLEKGIVIGVDTITFGN